MRFFRFFTRFWVNYRVFWGGCLSFLIDFGVIFFYKCIYLSTFAIVKITLHIYRQDLRVVQTKVHTNFKLLI